MYVAWDGILMENFSNASLKNVNMLKISTGTHFQKQILISTCYSHFDDSRYTRASY